MKLSSTSGVELWQRGESMKSKFGVLLLLFVALPLAAQTPADAVALYQQGKSAEAEVAFQKLAKTSPKNAQAQFYLGRLAFDRGNDESAGEYFEKAVSFEPRNSEYHLWLGRAYGIQAQKANIFSKASLAGKTKTEFEKAVELDPNNLDARSSLIDYYVFAPGIMGGSIDKAKQQAAEIAKRDPSRGVRETAKVYRLQKKWPEAEQIYAEAIRKNPADKDLRRDLGFLYQQSEQWAKAYQTFAVLVKDDPADMLSQYQIGRTAALSGQYLNEGEQALVKYLAYVPKADEPPLKWAHMRLGSIYEKKKRNDLAKAEYQKAVALDPKFKEAKDALSKLG
jgi:tetratricopeptide (TPR) repeat protein